MPEVFLSTPSARRATKEQRELIEAHPISIHALREEGDTSLLVLPVYRINFYPRPPRGGRPALEQGHTEVHRIFLSTPSARRATAPKTSSLVGALSFLSTPSARRATIDHSGYQFVIKNFYPRPPRGGRRLHGCRFAGLRNFYPRPPRGGRQPRSYDEILNDLFLSTPSARRATGSHHPHRPQVAISIHALREEGDFFTAQGAAWSGHFYPRPPRGGRRLPDGRIFTVSISIHALREEGDDRRRSLMQTHRYFYPRPPRGGRQLAKWSYFISPVFLSTPSARRATKTEAAITAKILISIHALREEGDPCPVS